VRRTLFALAAGVALVVGARPARASDPALDRFAEGRALLKAGNGPAACAKFRESVALRPTIGALARAAECDERDGHVVAAMRGWRHALTLAREANDDRRGAVEAAIQALAPRVPKVRVVSPAAVDGLSVQLDGEALTVGEDVEVDPGTHRVTAAAPGRRTFSRDLDVAEGLVRMDVTLELEEELPPAPPPTPLAAPVVVARDPDHVAPPATEPSPTEMPVATPRSKVLHDAAYGVVPVGLLGLIVGGVFAYSAATKTSDAGCNGLACPNDAAASTLRGAQRDANTATVFFVGGGALVLGGAAMWWFSRDTVAPASSLQLAPSVGRTSAGLSVEGRF
jgi:hypothetical protein